MYANFYLSPCDDAPRIADVFTNPNRQRCLEVGIGRPQALYVLYPWKGTEILCRGAAMPYYEFVSPVRLTDAEWQARLKTPPEPARPDWLRPILGESATRSSQPRPAERD